MILQILRWCILFRLKLIWRKKELLVAKAFCSKHCQNSSLQNFLDHLDISHTTDQQPTTLPFPRKEFASMLPTPNYSARGPHCLPQPSQEAQTSTASQHGEHTAPLNPKQEISDAPHYLWCPCFLLFDFISSKIHWVMIRLTFVYPNVLMYYGLS